MSTYDLVRGFAHYGIIKVFFRQVDAVGSFRIPTDGPVIFVANHANQFVDPMMLISNIDRVVRFLSAAKSLRRPIIGHFARGARAIGIERPQDLAKKGAGTVSLEADGVTVSGVGTSFMKELKSGFKIITKDLELMVKSVESDCSCTVSKAEGTLANASFKVLPKVDQSAVYGQVHKALKDGDCIGIFPEGGSHDRTGLLDLKPGVAIMALGAMCAGAGNVKIVPCGLNYIEPYRFRSRAVIEFGDAIEVPTRLAEKYETDKRGAVQELMTMVEDGMRALIPGADDFDAMQSLMTMRALYKPRGYKLTPDASLKLTRSFLAAGAGLKDDPRMQELTQLTVEYNEMLKHSGVKDRDVRLNLAGSGGVAFRTLKALVQVLALAPIAIPACLLATPIGMINYYMAQKEKKKALAGSVVKVKALDVVASYKIIVSIVTMPTYNVLLAAAHCWALRPRLGIAPRRWHFPFIYWLYMPLAEYGSVLACDAWFKALARLSATYHFFTRGSASSLVERRTELQDKIRALVEVAGPQFNEDFEKDRIISHQALQKDVDLMLAAHPGLKRNLSSSSPDMSVLSQ